MGTEVAEAQASNFVADVCVSGRSFTLRSTRQEGMQLFFLSKHEKEPELLNDAFIYSLRNSLMTLNLALDMCRLKAEELKDRQDILVFNISGIMGLTFSWYYSGFQKSPEEMAFLMANLMSQPLAKQKS